MKQITTVLLLILLSASQIIAQQALRMRMLGQWNDTTLAAQDNPFNDDTQIWNDLIGWTHPQSGREFVIMGSIDSTYFFDVTNPAQIRKCASYTGRNRVVNRDYDVYKNYVYCVSDNGPAGVFQIFDLQYLPDSVHLVLEDTNIITRVHSLMVDSANHRLYFNAASKTYSMFGDSINRQDLLILSLANPEQPVVIGELRDPHCGRVHESYVRNDTAYCSCEYRGLHAYNMNNPDSITYIGGISPPYPYNGYNHTSWLNDDGSFVVFTDEVPTGLPIKVYSISANKKEFDFETSFNSNVGATPHNVHWIGNKLWTSAYEDGVVLWDMSNPFSPRMEAFYDTYPQNKTGEYHGFTGCWGVYPFFKSGNIAASDMHNGLFMLQYDYTMGLSNERKQTLHTSIYPNPTKSDLNVKIYTIQKQQANLAVFNINGQLCFEEQIDLQEGENALKLEKVSGLHTGMYVMRIITQQQVVQETFIKN